MGTQFTFAAAVIPVREELLELSARGDARLGRDHVCPLTPSDPHVNGSDSHVSAVPVRFLRPTSRSLGSVLASSPVVRRSGRERPGVVKPFLGEMMLRWLFGRILVRPIRRAEEPTPVLEWVTYQSLANETSN